MKKQNFWKIFEKYFEAQREDIVEFASWNFDIVDEKRTPVQNNKVLNATSFDNLLKAGEWLYIRVFFDDVVDGDEMVGCELDVYYSEEVPGKYDGGYYYQFCWNLGDPEEFSRYEMFADADKMENLFIDELRLDTIKSIELVNDPFREAFIFYEAEN